jgi:NADH-quinone oxidoreductase subunit N
MNISFHAQDLYFLSPLLILTVGGLLILLLECFSLKKIPYLHCFVTLLTFAFAFVIASFEFKTQNILLTAWLKNDVLATFFTRVFLIVGFISALLGASFFKKFKEDDAEFYFLLIASVFGLILIGSSADFLTLFLGLETLSISLYILCGYVKKWNISHESAIKYFLLSSTATAFLLYGIALIYGATGTTNFESLNQVFKALPGDAEKMYFLVGIGLITLGLLFKATIVPFHSWSPDVYEGATTPVTAFMAVGTKIGAYAAFIRIFLEAIPQIDTIWNNIIAFLVFPTLIFANVVAIRQTNLRRFFAYSGMTHSAYLLIPLAASGEKSTEAILFYLSVYALATFGSFAVFSALDKEKRGLYITDISGLFWKSPFLAAVLTLSLLTLAGIPPTVGFFAKFYIFKVGFDAGFYAVVVFGLLMTVLSAYYYLRIISKMLTKPLCQEEFLNRTKIGSVIAALAFAGIILFSLFPDLIPNPHHLNEDMQRLNAKDEKDL